MKFAVAMVWIYKVLIPVGIIIAGVFAGLIAERVASTQFKKIRMPKNMRNVLQGAFKGMPFIWIVLVALDIALLNLHLSAAPLAQSQKVLQILLSASVTIVLARIASNLVHMFAYRVTSAHQSSTILVNLAKFCIYALGILVILQTMGISILPVLTALGIGGLAVSLALNDTLSNFFAGIHLLLSRQIRTGDFIRLDSGQEGYVTDISLHNTTIQQLSNDVVIIPNTRISSAIVINYTYGKLPDSTVLIPIEVDVDRNSDLEHVEAVSREVAKEVLQEVSGGVDDFKPLIYFKTLAEKTIHFTVTLKAQSYVNQYLLRHEFIKRLKQRLDSQAFKNAS